jgi:CheY-like chemotaxis protein
MSHPVLLCVDDQPELLRLRKAAFERLGCSVHVATTALAALAVLESTPIAAVLIEYKSEGMDTEAVAFHIKRRFPTQPVILLSAYADLPDRVLWLVDDYVVRSEPMERVVQVVQRMVSRTRQEPAA